MFARSRGGNHMGDRVIMKPHITCESFLENICWVTVGSKQASGVCGCLLELHASSKCDDAGRTYV